MTTDDKPITYGCWTTNDDPDGDEQAVLVLDPEHAAELNWARLETLGRLIRVNGVWEVVLKATRAWCRFGFRLFRDDDGDFNEWRPIAPGDLDPNPCYERVDLLLVLDEDGVRYAYDDRGQGRVYTRTLDWNLIDRMYHVAKAAEGGVAG